jgi:hypothetical protein
MSNIRSDLHSQARRAILTYAFFRWESAVVLAAAILLTFLLPRPFPWWPVWAWPLMGVLGIGAIIYSSLTDVEANARLLLALFQEQFDLREIRLPELRQEVEAALEYQRHIEQELRRRGPSLLWDRAEDTAGRLNDWIGNIYRLAKRLDAYRQDALLTRQRESVPLEIESLAERMRKESREAVREQLEGALQGKKGQWQVLKELDTRMEQAELQLKQTLAALATVHSQVKLIDAQDVDSGRSRRLREDIQEQIARLNDLLGSINEVYDYRGKGLA